MLEGLNTSLQQNQVDAKLKKLVEGVIRDRGTAPNGGYQVQPMHLVPGQTTALPLFSPAALIQLQPTSSALGSHQWLDTFPSYLSKYAAESHPGATKFPEVSVPEGMAF